MVHLHDLFQLLLFVEHPFQMLQHNFSPYFYDIFIRNCQATTSKSRSRFSYRTYASFQDFNSTRQNITSTVSKCDKSSWNASYTRTNHTEKYDTIQFQYYDAVKSKLIEQGKAKQLIGKIFKASQYPELSSFHDMFGYYGYVPSADYLSYI